MKKNIFANFVSEAMLHTNQTADGKAFVNVSIPCSKSTTGYASFAVNEGQVLAATKKDGTVVPGYKSILLGAADKTRKVSVATGDASNPYQTIEMTNADIVKEINESRKAYRAAQAEQAVETEEGLEQ